MTTIHTILDAIASTPKRSEKESIIASTSGVTQDLLKRVAYLAYNSHIKYFIALDESDADDSAADVDAGLSLNPALDILVDSVATRKVTGMAAADLLMSCIRKMSYHDALLFVRVVNKDLRIGCSDSTFNKVFPNLIPSFELMACQSLNEKTESKVKPGWFSQLKYDAARINVFVKWTVSGVSVEYVTRSGKQYHIKNPDMDTAFISAHRILGYDAVFDGELLQVVNGEIADRKYSNGIANKFIRDTAGAKDSMRCQIATWDVVPLATFQSYKTNPSLPYKARLAALRESLPDSTHAVVAETDVITDLDHALALAQKVMKLGLEGTIIKDPDGRWEAKRSFGSLKIKAIREADLLIVGKLEGTGKLVGKLGAIECESADGKIKVNVGTGFKDDERDLDQDIIGKIVTVRFNELIRGVNSTTYSLFLPRMVEIRFDKSEADTLQKIIDEGAHDQ